MHVSMKLRLARELKGLLGNYPVADGCGHQWDIPIVAGNLC